MKKRSGQILILVLLIVVVALAVGLSIASRNITNLRTSTQTAQSQRSFSAAEGGVEDVLSQLTSISAFIANPTGPSVPGCSVSGSQANCSVAVGDITATVNVTALPGFDSVIELGDVGQVNLQGLQTSCSTPCRVNVSWVKSSDAVESGNPATVEVTLIRDAGSGNIVQDRYAIRPSGSSHSTDETGSFLTAGGCVPASGYANCTQINVPVGGSNLPRLLRIKPFWNKTSAYVTTSSGSLPVQQYDVTSTATTELGVTRKVQVTRTALPQLPAVFDYAIYSDGDISK